MSELDDEIKIEKVNLVNDLDTIEKEIVSLKKLYSEINNYPNILIGLFNKKFTKQLNLIEASKPGTKYQGALTNLVLKKYIPNPEASETNLNKKYMIKKEKIQMSLMRMCRTIKLINFLI